MGLRKVLQLRKGGKKHEKINDDNHHDTLNVTEPATPLMVTIVTTRTSEDKDDAVAAGNDVISCEPSLSSSPRSVTILTTRANEEKENILTAVDAIEPSPTPRGPPPSSPVTIMTTSASEPTAEDHPPVAMPATTPVSLLQSAPSSIATFSGFAASTHKKKKKVRFFLEKPKTVDSVSVASTQEILEELDDMQLLLERAHSKDPINVVVVTDDAVANDDAIELEIPTSKDNSSSDDDIKEDDSRGHHHDYNKDNRINVILKTALGGTLGCIQLSAETIRESGNHIDQLLESAVEQIQEARKTSLQQKSPRHHKRAYSPIEVMHQDPPKDLQSCSTAETMYRLINFMDRKSYMLEETAGAADETAAWFQCDGRSSYDEKWFMSELHEGAQCFSNALRESMMRCQARNE